MKRTIPLLSLLMASTPAMAQNCTTTTYGNQAYMNCSDGFYANQQTYGNQSYTHYSDGTYANTMRYGNQSYTTYGPGNLFAR